MKILTWLTIIILLTASLGQLNRLPLAGGDGIVVYANDILIGLMAGLYLLHVLIIRKSWVIHPALLWFGLFVAVAPLGLLLTLNHLESSQIIVSLFYWLRYVSYAVIALIVFDAVAYAKTAQQAEHQTQHWLRILLIASLLMSVSGFIQLYILPDFAELAQYGWDPHVGRLATAMLDPNYAGAYLSIGAIVSASWLLFTPHKKQRLIMAIILGVLVVAIGLTFSRSAYLMLVAGLAIVAFFKARWLLIAAAIIGLVAFTTIPRVNERVIGALTVDVTASIRITSWFNSWQIARDNLTLGVGFNSYRYAQDRYGIVNQEDSGNAGAGADSSWLFILATTGILGLAAYLAFYGHLILNSGRHLLSLTSELTWLEKTVHLSVVAMAISLIPASMINNSLFYTWILQLWWLLIGLALALDYNRRRNLH